MRKVAFALAAIISFAVIGTAVSLYAHGYRVWVVHTGSMEPTYMPGDVVVDRPPTGHYAPGEVLTFRHSDLTTDVVTHRVIDVTRSGLIHTKGDANATADAWEIRPDQVRGSVQFKITGLGYLLVFLRQPAGSAAIATLLLATVLLWQLFFPTTNIDIAGDTDTSTDTDTDGADTDTDGAGLVDELLRA